uniref:Uncharacterized protein n=1 Tax=Physcomitrium patens TaxID=3218 RepID=A0A7I4BFW0_PHYPA
MAMAGSRRMGLLALLPLLSNSHDAVLSHSNAYEKNVKEPFTGIEFEQQKQIDNNDYHLQATAVRCMLGQCKMAMARAYAIGLYTEDKQPVNETAVLTGAMNRILVLVMDKDVAGHHIAKGFDKSLLPRIRKAQAGSKRGSGKDAVSGRSFVSVSLFPLYNSPWDVFSTQI